MGNHERPASTDIKDVIEDKPKAAHGGHGHGGHGHGHSNEGPGTMTAGPSESDRWGEGKVANDAHGRILGVSVHGDFTRLMIGLGPLQGVHNGMPGYVIDQHGAIWDFSVEVDGEAKHGAISYAMVNAPPQQFQGNSTVVINPSSRPVAQPKHDMRARILANSIEGGKTKIMIGMGEQHGARIGQKGYVIGHGGKAYEHFEIVEQRGGISYAYITSTIDELHGNDPTMEVILNPST
jgi:hypothetical protein